MSPTYQLHHPCIYEKNPRDAMWNWLKWYDGGTLKTANS